MKLAVVDIDDTTFPFREIWNEELNREFGLGLPVGFCPPSYDYFRNTLHLDPARVQASIDRAHERRLEVTPLPGAREMLALLGQHNYRILLASHCDEQHKATTEQLFKRHDLDYHEMHLVSDKSIFFKPGALLIDDSPDNLIRGCQAGMMCVGLRYRYNQHLTSNTCALFNDLTDLHAHLERALVR